MAKVFEIARITKKVAQEDPRRVTHSVKVGVALTLVSSFYYCQPLFDNFGVSAMWAVMTVGVVFEFSVGATVGKGLNRGLGTLLGGALGVGAYYLARLCGQTGKPILLGLFVFVQASTSTFVRFFPKIKARYDYGMLIFILTFSLISISGVRDDEILNLALKRLYTIGIGAVACVIISISVHPVWAGEDLHNRIALNMEKLGKFLHGIGDEESFTSVLSSKSSDEDSLANFASWEPRHGWNRHPWKNYLPIGNLTRDCAKIIQDLKDHLNSDDHLQASPEIPSKIQEAYTKTISECGNALREFATAVKIRTQPSSSVRTMILNAKAAAISLEALVLQSGLSEDDVVLYRAVYPRLHNVFSCTEKIAGSIHELASLAHFTSEIIDSPQSP